MVIFLLAVMCWHHESDEIPFGLQQTLTYKVVIIFDCSGLCCCDILFVDWTQCIAMDTHVHACMCVHTRICTHKDIRTHVLFNLYTMNSANDEVIETFLWNYLSWSKRGQTIEMKDTVMSLLLLSERYCYLICSERYCSLSERYCCLYFIILFFV